MQGGEEYEEDVRYYLDVYNVFILRIFGQILANPEEEGIKLILYEIFLKVYVQGHEELLGKVTAIFHSIIKRLVADPKDTPETLKLKQRFVQVHSSLFLQLIQASFLPCQFTVVGSC